MNQRKYVRIESNFNVWYQTINVDDTSFGKPPSKNISAGGILLEMESLTQIGTYLVLRFEVPNYPKKIEAKGKVNWIKKLDNGNFDIGIEFTDILPEDMDAINRLG